ncbi:hypothetical protein EKQ44_01990 [Sutcliffiella horikoshii]|nr:hypothetical protein [Sutcliffiella horikoshii]
MLTHFLRAMNRCRSIPCPAGGRDMEDPAGRSPRRLKVAPRKAKPSAEINSGMEQITKIMNFFSGLGVARGGFRTARGKQSSCNEDQLLQQIT